MTFTLRERLSRSPIVTAPGVYDSLSAALAEQAGFELIFLSGSALSFASLGRPDVGVLTAGELVDACGRISDRISIPMVVDGDSGYGSVANLQRLVRQLERAGAAAIQIEDQAGLKPPSALQSRPLVPASEMVGRIRAAQDSRGSDDFLISARTDAMATMGMDEALRRGHLYVEAGCDLLFVEGLSEEWQLKKVVQELGSARPLVHNLLEGGRSPARSAGHLQDLGYSVALFPGSIIGAAVTSIRNVLSTLKVEGTTSGMSDRVASSRALNDIVGTPDFLDKATRYGPGESEPAAIV